MTPPRRLIGGRRQPSEGDMLFEGRRVLDGAPERRGAVMVFQKHRLFPHMSVADNVGFGLKMRGVGKTEIGRRVGEMLELVQLPGFERRRANELSGGQQQRVALARALIIEPQVLLLDEPLANLDANLRLEMRQLIRSLQRTLGITTLFVTHDHEEAVMMADRVALIMEGVLQQYDRPRVLYERPCSATVAHFFRNENLLPGIRRGAVVDTDLGELSTAMHPPAPDGPVLLTVRPEHIAISCDGHGGNCLPGVVGAAVYMGTYTQLCVDVAGSTWIVQAPANATYVMGQALTLELPPDHVWLMPQ